MKQFLFTIIFAILFFGCAEDEIDTFNSDDAGIYFQQVAMSYMGSTQVTYKDSLVVSFIQSGSKVKQSTYTIPVLIMGNVRDYDRTFKVRIDEEKTTAVLGTHFKINFDSLYIYANKNSFKLPVTLIRHPDLLKQTLRIELLLEECNDFKLLIPEYKYTNLWTATGMVLAGTRFKIIFSERHTEPRFWGTVSGLLGKWTSQKFLFLNEVMEWTLADWDKGGFSGSKITYGRVEYAVTVFQKELQKRADQQDPVLDEGGEYMQLPAPFEVDYSKLTFNNK